MRKPHSHSNKNGRCFGIEDIFYGITYVNHPLQLGIITQSEINMSLEPNNEGNANAAEICLTKAEWQSIIFEKYPRRFNLQKLTARWDSSSFHLQIHRNQPFEFIASMMTTFLTYANLEADITYSDYDDALNFNQLNKADVELIWLDYERYHGKLATNELLKWLIERISVLRKRSAAPILISDWASPKQSAQTFNQGLQKALKEIPDTYLCAQSEIFSELGERYFDQRTLKIAATTISDLANSLSARMFGLVWLPSVLMPRLKAIVLDLDNTLYSGVLGEDGVEGILLNEGFIRFQQSIVKLRDKGIFIAICSRNELVDVEKLFAQRTDFPLKWGHLSAKAVSWNKKADGLRQIANDLRIGIDAMLFIDDNPGELAAVVSELPEIKCLHATKEPLKNERALRLFPRLWQWQTSNTDKLRITDLEASKKRAALEAKTPENYLKSLDIRLKFALNQHKHIHRLHELSVKTNQFNTAFLRLSESDVQRKMSEPAHYAISIQLQDRLSDSGIIGAVFMHCEQDTLFVDEICISCRALGRGLENLMINETLRAITKQSISKIAIAFSEGSRNKPAKDWLKIFSNQIPTHNKFVYIDWKNSYNEKLPVTISWE